MLSILIPTYKYNAYPLAQELNKQCNECDITFEILVYDDGSKSSINTSNKNINLLKDCFYKELPNNIGRSAIRNLLAKNAQFDNLLFIDAGTFPENADFIKSYLLHIDKKVINGGMTYRKEIPKKPYKLRWLITKKRESKSLCSSNFLIKKFIFYNNPFDESILKYGYEDVTFFKNLIKNNIEITTIKNSVIHDSEDSANTFIEKTELAMQNLAILANRGILDKYDSKIYKYYLFILNFRLTMLINSTFKLFKNLLKLNFNSSYPLLFLYDFYRLGYFCTINKN
ncbi:glycosyltransferase [Sabulilitoribacter multivorans]|uniref:Glycosyltransferase n=1 Tax=Flaviramulus multivorans TaxID=1304750 RepID=A0ABS9IIV6_9FLAO|nr:glycosyltransferase [Flaviramulus multivorans]MCF7560420.1 glycosyltransferase [Flaviramulus multivorans]